MRSIALYGAPVSADPESQNYRAIATTAMRELEARALAAFYQWRKGVRELGKNLEIREIVDQKFQLRQVLEEKWKDYGNQVLARRYCGGKTKIAS